VSIDLTELTKKSTSIDLNYLLDEIVYHHYRWLLNQWINVTKWNCTVRFLIVEPSRLCYPGVMWTLRPIKHEYA